MTKNKMLIFGAKIQISLILAQNDQNKRKFKYLKSFETFKRNFLTLWELIEIFLRRGPLVPKHFSSLRSIIYYLRSKSLFDDSFIHFSLEEGGKRPQKLEVQSKRKDVKTATEKESMRSPDNCMLVMFDGFVCFYGKKLLYWHAIK